MIARTVARRGACALGIALLAVAAPATAQRVTWSSSLDYAEDAYVFSDTYRSISWLNSLTLNRGRFDLTASWPILAQNGTVLSYVAGGAVPTGGPDNGAVRRRSAGQTVPVRPGRRGGNSRNIQGALGSVLAADTVPDSLSVAGTGAMEIRAGDPMFGATLATFEGNGAVRSFGVEAWTKVPVTSVESGVGTGAWDYGAGASLVLGNGRALFFANATWWVLGDMPDLELRDALFYSLALGVPIRGAWSLLTSASASTSIIAGSDPPVSAHLLVSRSLSDGAAFSLGAGVGLSESASDFTVSLGWTTRLLDARR